MEGRLQPGDDARAVARAVQQGHRGGSQEPSRGRADHHGRTGQDGKAGRGRREPDRPAGRRAADLAEGIGGPHRRRRKGDRRQDPGDRARPQRRHQAHHPVHRRRQRADRQGRRRICGEAARRPGQGGGQRRRDLGRHGHAARARPSRRLPRLHRQGAGHQVPAQQPVGRLEAGQGLQHHDDGAAQQREDRPGLRPQRSDGLRRLSRRQGRGARQGHQVHPRHRRAFRTKA